MRGGWQRERSPEKRRLAQPDVMVRARREAPYPLRPLQTVLVDREVVVGLGTIGAAGHLSHRPASCRGVRGLKLDYSAMRKLNEEGPRLPKAAKERDDILWAVFSTHIRLTNLPDTIGAPQSGECVGIVVIHCVGELS